MFNGTVASVQSIDYLRGGSHSPHESKNPSMSASDHSSAALPSESIHTHQFRVQTRDRGIQPQTAVNTQVQNRGTEQTIAPNRGEEAQEYSRLGWQRGRAHHSGNSMNGSASVCSSIFFCFSSFDSPPALPPPAASFSTRSSRAATAAGAGAGLCS